MGREVQFTRAMNYCGRRATIMGLGHFGGGAAAARWLAEHGAIVTVSDAADENSLADSLPLVADVPIVALHLGGHRDEDFRGADLVVVNPAVRPDSPWLDVARQSGARLCTELELFIENCPARIVGVTGSNGKSTTAAMIASILKRRRTANLSWAATSAAACWATAEEWRQAIGSCWKSAASSCGIFTPARARCRHIAVVTGCTPNHLDWHASFADYAAAKQRILTGQTPDDFAVLNTLDAEVASWLPLVRGRQMRARLPPDVCPTTLRSAALSVPGEHNRINAACAAAAARRPAATRGDIGRDSKLFVVCRNGSNVSR